MTRGRADVRERAKNKVHGGPASRVPVSHTAVSTTKKTYPPTPRTLRGHVQMTWSNMRGGHGTMVNVHGTMVNGDGRMVNVHHNVMQCS